MFCRRRNGLLLLLLVAGLPVGSGAQVMGTADLLALPHPPADARLPYGEAPQQFGELRVPTGPGPHPVVVVVHGGCWESAFDLTHLDAFGEALRGEGLAVWSLEYRRLDDPGGGWPGTFADVTRGLDHLRVLARRYPLDLNRVVVAGHSAGGHLALWLAARPHLPPDHPLWSDRPLPLHGVLALAAVSDLEEGARRSVCGDAVVRLMDGTPDANPGRYALGNPRRLLPTGVSTRLLHGRLDTIVPPAMSVDFGTAARQAGDDTDVVLLGQAGHFELVTPGSNAWEEVRAALADLLGSEPPGTRR